MKCSQPVLLACVLILPHLVGAQLAGPATDSPAARPLETPDEGSGRHHGAETASSTLTTTNSVESSRPTAFAASSSISATYSTTTNTIDISSFLTSGSQSASDTIPISAANADVTDSPTSPTSSSTSLHKSNDNRTLIIVLSSVLGSVAILLIAAAIFFIRRYSQGRSRFGTRSATPLDDEEIDSWRGTVIEQKEFSPEMKPTMLHRQRSLIQTIPMQPSPGWTWTASPTSSRSAPSPSTTVPTTPAFVARAPNSRAGLTDETVRGAEPFVPPIKRQASRLSKAPPGHGRTKSSRSSTSAKSVWSYSGGTGCSEKTPIWYEPDENELAKSLSRINGVRSDSLARSTFDDVAGGLSPRPQSSPRVRDTDIGRAIA